MSKVKPHDHFRPFWHLIDATALGQDKRAAAYRRDLAQPTRADPDLALRALADIASMAIDLAATYAAATESVDLARMEVLRDLGHRVNRTAPLHDGPLTGPG